MTTKAKSVYEELGFANHDEMLIKARLVTEIADQLKRRNLTQTEAATLLGFTQPKLSGVLRGQFRGVSEKKLMECLTKLGQDVQITIKSAPKSRREGKISVAFA